MLKEKKIATLIRENRTLFIIIAVVLFLVELEIFALAAMKSGRKSWLQVIDATGNVIHETDGKNLSDFNKYYFEKTFGPFEQYQVKLATKDFPFPFRAWFVAAVGIPIGAILLFAFAVQAYLSLFYKKQSSDEFDVKKNEYEYRFEKVIAAVTRFNIFTIGFLVLLGVLSYWVVPDLLVHVGRLGVETLARYKWIFLSFGMVFLGLILWIIYLKYLLAKKAIDIHAEIDKYRLQLEFDKDNKYPLRLVHDQKETTDGSL
ncbi:MAG: hypothetical protein SRB2_02495 [Desulfobacteraceae bacterium Eth-SRB2]|nr:MAG: hypothetical protein SRB2_02495 [Desulfobacteraceae bacterium Eth-SRB2]